MNDSGSQAEFQIIDRYLSAPELSFEREGVVLGIGDDAAIIDVPQGRQLAMSMDVLIEGVHFPPNADPALVANRALAVNLSDLAAMAAEPLCFTLGLVLPDSDPSWMQKFSAGLAPLARHYNCPLVGGDISSGARSICIQVQGLVEKGAAVRRSGARPGDKVYVSGTLGDAALALAMFGLATHLGDEFVLSDDNPSASCTQFFTEAYYKPQPQIELARVAGDCFTSAIDISDGLHGDLQHILDASDCGATIRLDALPYSASARCCVDDQNRLRAALFGGDDYGLCFTVAADRCAELERLGSELAAPLSCIGDIVEGARINYLDERGDPVRLDAEAFQHFNSQRAN